MFNFFELRNGVRLQILYLNNFVEILVLGSPATTKLKFLRNYLNLKFSLRTLFRNSKWFVLAHKSLSKLGVFGRGHFGIYLYDKWLKSSFDRIFDNLFIFT